MASDDYMKGIKDGYNAIEIDMKLREREIREKIAQEIEDTLDLPPISDEEYLIHNVVTSIVEKIRGH